MPHRFDLILVAVISAAGLLVLGLLLRSELARRREKERDAQRYDRQLRSLTGALRESVVTYDLELRLRGLHVLRRDQRILLEATTESGRAICAKCRHALGTVSVCTIGSSRAALTAVEGSRISRLSASTRRPTFGHAISLP